MNSDALGNIQSEIGQLKSELDRIASTTTFNGKKLLDGTYQAAFQVGANSGETISVNIGTAMGSTGLAVSGVDVTGVGTYTAGAVGAGKVSTVNAAAAAAATLTFTEPVAGDDFLDATGAVAVASFQKLTGTISFGGKTFDMGSVDYSTATTGAQARTLLNTAAKSALGLTVDPFAAGTATTITFAVAEPVNGFTAAGGAAVGGATATAQAVAAATPTFSAATGASTAINALDAAIKRVSTQRADLGAIQNRFDHTINNLNVAVENLTASESRIRDADMAQEMVQFTRNQILSQAGTAMLAQANQASQGVLQLLQR
jgi:flagellin-like hook-associated protein FlgL